MKEIRRNPRAPDIRRRAGFRARVLTHQMYNPEAFSASSSLAFSNARPKIATYPQVLVLLA
jgi:hypothetical protein